MTTKFVFVFAALALFLSACSVAVEATPTVAPSDTPMPSATATAVPTLTPTLTPTATPTPTPIRIGKSRRIVITAGDGSRIHFGWVAATVEFAQDFIDAIEITMKVDGQEVSGDLKKYWEPIVEYHTEDLDGYVAYWVYPLADSPALRIPGVHHVEVIRLLTREASDGFPGDELPAGAVLPFDFDVEVIP